MFVCARLHGYFLIIICSCVCIVATFLLALRFRCCGLSPPFVAGRRKPQAVTLGPRVLRSDVAVSALLALAHAWVDERAVGGQMQLPEQ